ncbi:MAG: uncharacterized protein KVP18_005098 [Porospora cf. gigantea A]|uniref:uncharacterized protein n=1 Tax=Porospora cf. gigantea A TaxID=2853593 RepID=UPI00355A4265|nr:MAG: hypothetical protein KVP18_005098 [Porospora cf. gigantea A]
MPSRRKQVEAAEEYESPDGVSSTDVEVFKRRLEDEIGVLLLLSDGTRLSCTMQLNAADQTLSMFCEANVRVVQLSEIFKILSHQDQLRRIETRAAISEDPNCAAVQLSSGYCIPVRFDSTHEKECFVELLSSHRLI